jgi:hypothetical protein
MATSFQWFKNKLQIPLLNNFPIQGTELIGDSLEKIKQAYVSLDSSSRAAYSVLLYSPAGDKVYGDLLTWNGELNAWVSQAPTGLTPEHIPRVARSWSIFRPWKSTASNIILEDSFNVQSVEYVEATQPTASFGSIKPTIPLLNTSALFTNKFVIATWGKSIKVGATVTNVDPNNAYFTNGTLVSAFDSKTKTIVIDRPLNKTIPNNTTINIGGKPFIVPNETLAAKTVLNVRESDPAFNSILPTQSVYVNGAPTGAIVEQVKPDGDVILNKSITLNLGTKSNNHYRVKFVYSMPSRLYSVFASGCIAIPNYNLIDSQNNQNSYPWNYTSTPSLGKFCALQSYDHEQDGYKLKWKVPAEGTDVLSGLLSKGTVAINSVVYAPATALPGEKYNAYIKIWKITPEKGSVFYARWGDGQLHFSVHGNSDSIFQVRTVGGFGRLNKEFDPQGYDDGVIIKNGQYVILDGLNFQVERGPGKISELAGINAAAVAATDSNWYGVGWTGRNKSSKPGGYTGPGGGREQWNGSGYSNTGPYEINIVDITYGYSWRFKMRPPSPLFGVFTDKYTQPFPGYIYEVDSEGEIIKDQVFIMYPGTVQEYKLQQAWGSYTVLKAYNNGTGPLGWLQDDIPSCHPAQERAGKIQLYAPGRGIVGSEDNF